MDSTRAKSRGRAIGLELWRRQLEAEAEQQVQGQGGSNQDLKPVVGPSPAEAKAEAEIDAITKHRNRDAFEAGQVQQGQRIRRSDADAIDSQQDGEMRAGQHLRLKERPAPSQPPQNLLTTLAAQRKHGARTKRRVAQAGGKKTGNGFGHLPHQGLWKAQPMAPQGTAPVPKKPEGPQLRAQVAFS